jgi:hypothetical protein
VASTAVYVTRVTEGLDDAGLHKNYLTVGGGMVLPLANRIDLEIGGAGCLFRGGASREIYYSRLDVEYSGSTAFFVFVQAEGGNKTERAGDVAAGLGLGVTY